MTSGQELATYAHDLENRNQELIEARESALLAARAKSEFLSNMSHELRTPLNAILGMGELLTETPLDSQQNEFVSVIRRNGESLLQLIDDILNFSRLESGQLPLNLAPFDLHAVLSRVYEMLKPLAQKKNLTLKLDLQTPSFQQVIGDAKKLEQILINLIGNAIKFTEQGSVSIVVRPDSSQLDQYLFSIQDTGIGIDAKELNELFVRFSQLAKVHTKSYGGTGLGLAISKQLVELMGGRVWIESEPQKGSTFHFTAKLPSAEEAAPKAPPLVSPERKSLEGLRVLLVEDSPDNRLLISLYLRETGCVLDTAENGKSAVEKFESKDYDLVLMDIQMPEMDGYSATRWIRLMEKTKRSQPLIIALTAFAMKEEAAKSLAAGCDLHLNKPVTKQALLNAIDSVLNLKNENFISAEL